MKTKILFFALFIFFQNIAAQEITGSWKGELEIQGTKLPLVIHVAKDGNGFKSNFDSPMQGAKGIPIQKTVFENGEITFEAPDLGISYKGKPNGDKIEGIFSQNGFQAPLILVSTNMKEKSKITVGKLPDNYLKNLEKISDFLNYLDKNSLEAGKLSVFKDGKEIYQKTFGQQNLPGNNPENKYFQIGSITKTMTGIMLHQLAENGKINLDDKLSEYYPEITNADKITLKQMLNHTAGLGDYATDGKEEKWLTKSVSEKDILNHIKAEKSVFEPGTSVQYSNSAYYLLTKILEKTTKKSFAENLQNRILKPLKMTHTFTAEQNPKNVFPGYSYASGKWNPEKDFDFKNVVGVGDIAADSYDLNVFINELFAGKLISKENLQSIKPKNNDRFGMGIIKIPFHNKTFLGHSGGTYTTNSLMIYNEEDNIAISYSLNADRIGSNNFAIGILSILYGLDYEYPVFSNAKLSAEQMEKYVGNYTSAEMPLSIKIFIKDNALFAQGKGQLDFPLEFSEENTFKFDMANLKLIFQPEENKMTLIQNGSKFQYQKEK